jgi:HEAT repeat protein
VVSAALACETLEAAQAFIEQLTRTLQVHRLEDDAVGTASVLLDVVLIERQVAALTGSSDHANTNGSTKNSAATANIGGGNAELSALWTATFEQFATSGALRLVATLLSSDALDHGSLLSVMQRAGDAGAGALIAELIAESDRTKRRALFDTIVVVRAGLPLLLRSLQHPMWYVVRNSAALLGAMRAPNVEPQLAMTLAHTDERVRLAATTALSRIGTTAAIGALGAAMRDRSAAVRHRAFRQLRKAQGTSINATVVGDALELERNADAQRELLDALLASTSPETVQRIVKLCSPSSRGVFSAELRITMFEALMRLRPAAAMPILRMAAEDRDPVVRARARELMATPVPTPTATPTPVAVATA